ncbi:MAG: fumarylacetoacetate hydrolase [Streptosporangiales bacterium]|nr:fumarylacetoacetate hydrolase [Streptosporangiales bacterium]
MGDLLTRPLGEITALVEGASGPGRDLGDLVPLPPTDGLMEVWAAGVTYQRSREARTEESTQADAYTAVYDAKRPELFFKSVPWRVVTDGEPIAVREDSGLDVPEAELALVLNAYAEVVGYTVCDDVSSRTIEGENPLYLPQAKVYAGSCALAAGVRPAWEVADPNDLAVSLTVERDGGVVWEGHTSTARLHRTFADLVEHLFREAPFPQGVILATGTGIVPEMSFTLRPGDRVTMEVAEVGHLSNPVVAGKDAMSWLVAAATDPRERASVRLRR